MKNKDKLLLLIYTLDLIAFEYSKVSSNHWNLNEIIKFLRLQVKLLLLKDYSQNKQWFWYWMVKTNCSQRSEENVFEKHLSKFS